MSFSHNCNKGGRCDHQSALADTDGSDLNLRIDKENLQCLNEESDGSCKKIFRAWDDRLVGDHYVASDVDQELLFNIPFNGTVKLKSIVVIGEDNGSHPYSIRLYKNKPYMTFDDLSTEFDQEVELAKDPEGLIAYPLRPVKFSSVSHLSIFVSRNYANDNDTQTKISFIGLKGDFIAEAKQQVLITTYEAQPNPADHKVDFAKQVFHDVS